MRVRRCFRVFGDTYLCLVPLCLLFMVFGQVHMFTLVWGRGGFKIFIFFVFRAKLYTTLPPSQQEPFIPVSLLIDSRRRVPLCC